MWYQKTKKMCNLENEEDPLHETKKSLHSRQGTSDGYVNRWGGRKVVAVDELRGNSVVKKMKPPTLKLKDKYL
jgi:hypothetical protein